MGVGAALRKKCVAVCMAVVSLIGLSYSDAFAVAGKITSPPPGVALSGGSLTLEFDEPLPDGKTEITVPVGPQGEINVPEGVDPNRSKRCRYTNDKGETVTFRCGGYFAMAGGALAATAGAAGMAAPHRASLIHRLLDTELIFQAGQSWTSGINSTSSGAPPGGAPFLQGSGGSEASQFSYNFMLRHLFDRFAPVLGGRPFVYFQGSAFNGFDGTGGSGVSGTGLDRTALQRRISHAFGGGIGYTHPVYCPNGANGGECFEAGIFVGAKAIRQELSASADEAGNVRSFRTSFYQFVPSGGAILTAPGIWKGTKFVATYEVMGLNSAALAGSPSFFNNIYNYRSDGGLIHNLWFGLSFNLGVLFCDPL